MRRRRPRQGFTLVELLGGVGIIALLIAILLPSLNRSREQARRVQCAAQLREIAAAAAMYANQYKGWLPASSQRGAPQPHDWVHWLPAPAHGGADESALAPFLGRPLNEQVLRCPSDDVSAHNPFGGRAYPYSYAMNMLAASNWRQGLRVRVTAVRNSSQKVLFVEEEVAQLDDGQWLREGVIASFPILVWPPAVGVTPLAGRHDSQRTTDPQQLRGNAAFVDGHVDFVTRQYASDPLRYDPQK